MIETPGILLKTSAGHLVPARIIPLTQGQFALVDEADYEWLFRWDWYAHWSSETRSFYAERKEVIDGKSKCILMHREILGAGPDELVDHVHHQTLNNCKFNLRRCTTAENNLNRVRSTRNATGFKGVTMIKATGRFQATIKRNGIRTNLGFYGTAGEAAVAYNKAAAEMFGGFAYFNRVP